MSNDDQGRGYGQPGQPYPRQGREQGYQYGDPGHLGQASASWDERDRQRGGYSPYGEPGTADVPATDRRQFDGGYDERFEGDRRGPSSPPAKQPMFRDEAPAEEFRQPRPGFDESGLPPQQGYRERESFPAAEPAYRERESFAPEEQSYHRQGGFPTQQTQSFSDNDGFGPRKFSDEDYHAPEAGQGDKFDQYLRRTEGDVVAPERPPRGVSPFAAFTDLNFQQTLTPALATPTLMAAIGAGLLVWLGFVVHAFVNNDIIGGVVTLLFGWVLVGFWVLLVRMVVEHLLHQHHDRAARLEAVSDVDHVATPDRDVA